MSRNRSLEEIQEDIRTLTRVLSEFIHAKLDELAEEIGELEKPKWIPCSERMPDDDDYRDYLVLVENHIGDTPMICQCNPEYGFGYYKDIYDPVTLGFVDTEFATLDELGYEKALYWMQLPAPPVEEEGE